MAVHLRQARRARIQLQHDIKSVRVKYGIYVVSVIRTRVLKRGSRLVRPPPPRALREGGSTLLRNQWQLIVSLIGKYIQVLQNCKCTDEHKLFVGGILLQSSIYTND